MTDAMKEVITEAVRAYNNLDDDEREVFHLLVDALKDEPSPKRGRLRGGRTLKPAQEPQNA